MLPKHYHESRFVVLARDPSTLYAYWDIQTTALKELARQVGETAYARSAWAICLTNLKNNASEHIRIDLEARNWYLAVHPGCQYAVEIGILRPDGVFCRALSASTVHIPPLGYSHIYDKQWMILEEDYRKLMLDFTGWVESSPGMSVVTPARADQPAETSSPPQEVPTSPGAPSYKER